MVIWVKDKTGRFSERPHYKPEELDFMSEEIISSYLRNKYGSIRLPVHTDDLTLIIERDTSDLDLYADLSSYGEDVEGATNFFPNQKPAVLISETLSEQPRRKNRLRTTLAHEYGHVKLHSFLWSLVRPRLLPGDIPEKGPRCKRETILNAPQTDWMEWQASYFSGSILMPITSIKHMIGDFMKTNSLYSSLNEDSPEAVNLISLIADNFSVSRDAARVRLAKLGYLSNITQSASLL